MVLAARTTAPSKKTPSHNKRATDMNSASVLGPTAFYNYQPYCYIMRDEKLSFRREHARHSQEGHSDIWDIWHTTHKRDTATSGTRGTTHKRDTATSGTYGTTHKRDTATSGTYYTPHRRGTPRHIGVFVNTAKVDPFVPSTFLLVQQLRTVTFQSRLIVHGEKKTPRGIERRR